MESIVSTNVNRAQGQNCLVTRSRVNVRVLTHDLNVHIHMVCIITDAMYSEMCGVLNLNLNHTIISNFIIVYLLFTTLYRPTYSYLHDRHDCYLCQSRSLCHSVHSFGLTQWIPIYHQTYVALANWMIAYDQAGLSDCFVWQCFRHLHSTCLPSSNCISVPRI